MLGALFLWANLLASSPAYAANLSIFVDTESTGGIAGPFNTIGDPYCPSSLTSGCDFSALDGRVRTHDYVRYKAGIQVGPSGDDVTMTVTLNPGLIIEEIPGGCDPFLSSVSGNGSSGSPAVLTCGLGNQSSAALDIFFDARVIGSLGNGTDVGVDSVVLDGPTSTSVTAPAVSDIEVTAAPRIDIHKRLHSYIPNTRGGVLGVDVGYQVWVGLRTNTGVDPQLGSELVTDDIEFVDDLTGISPNAYVYQCTTLSNSSAVPYSPFNSALPDHSVLDAGGMSCDNTGTSATGSVNVTIAGADLSFEHIPTYIRNGSTVASRVSDFKAASYGVIRVFVPLSDITAAGGSLATVNRYRDLDFRSITNQLNFNGSGEDETNNTIIPMG